MRIVPWLAMFSALAAVSGAALGAINPKDPQQRPAAADETLARSIALRLHDMGLGWKVDSPSKSAATCTVQPDESALVQTAFVDPTFVWKDGTTHVGSEVAVFKTTAMAGQDWKVSTLSTVTACMLQDLRAQLGSAVHVSVVASKRLTVPASAERSFHYRVEFRVRASRSELLFADTIGLGRGRINVTMRALASNGPLSAAVAKALTGMLAQRLRAAAGG